MKTHSLLAAYLTLSACPTFAGETFLTELNRANRKKMIAHVISPNFQAKV